MNANKQQISRQDIRRNLTLWHTLLHNSSFASIQIRLIWLVVSRREKCRDLINT